MMTCNNFGLKREHNQRAEIIKGWKSMGMKRADIGLLSDLDEIFTRDFLRAVQTCDDVEFVEYEKHHCRRDKVKAWSSTLVFEGSPECITKDRRGYHPDMIVGGCIEGIADEAEHPSAPRYAELSHEDFLRAAGYGLEEDDWAEEDRIVSGRYHSWNAADFRRTRGGQKHMVTKAERKGLYNDVTAFHLHNFFNDLNATRFKYRTYGHEEEDAYTKPIASLAADLEMMVNCAKNLTDHAKWQSMPGGLNSLLPFIPIYFEDEDYCHRRHLHLRRVIEADERMLESASDGRATTREEQAAITS